MGSTTVSETEGAKTLSRELFHLSGFRAIAPLLPLGTRMLGLGLKGSSPHLEHYLRLFHQGPIVTEISLVAGGTSAVCTCLVSVPSGEVAVTVTG